MTGDEECACGHDYSDHEYQDTTDAPCIYCDCEKFREDESMKKGAPA